MAAPQRAWGPRSSFANNLQLPVMQYGRLELSSPEGLYWQLQISRAAAALAIASVLMSAPRSGQPLGSPGP